MNPTYTPAEREQIRRWSRQIQARRTVTPIRYLAQLGVDAEPAPVALHTPTTRRRRAR
jgi:hypothetical protein